MRVDLRPSMPGKVLGAGERAGVLAALDPAPHEGGDPIRIRAEGAGLDDGVLRQHIEIGDRGENPIDADGPRLLRGDGAGPAHHRGILQRGERRRRGEFGEPFDLLASSALEVRGDEQRPAGPAEQVGGEPADCLHRPTKDDEPTDADRQCVGDGGRFVGEAAVRPPAQRGHDEPGGLMRRRRRGHAGVTVPSTRGPAAPVAEGTLPGWPWSVR